MGLYNDLIDYSQNSSILSNSLNSNTSNELQMKISQYVLLACRTCAVSQWIVWCVCCMSKRQRVMYKSNGNETDTHIPALRSYAWTPSANAMHPSNRIWNETTFGHFLIALCVDSVVLRWLRLRFRNCRHSVDAPSAVGAAISWGTSASLRSFRSIGIVTSVCWYRFPKRCVPLLVWLEENLNINIDVVLNQYYMP